MEFVDKESPVEVEVTETKRTARVNPNLICGDCVITPEEYKESLVAPVDRILFPKDISDIKDDDEMVYIIGTKDGKVTKMGGFENMKNLKVSSLFVLDRRLMGQLDDCIEMLPDF